MLRGLLMWLRALFTRRRVESEMQREMRLHLELETAENLRRGLDPAAARRAALVAFGGVEQFKEAVRDERRTRWLEQGISDVRLAARSFRKARGLVASVVLLLALGVGANAALFSVLYRQLVVTLPFPDGARMRRIVAEGNGGKLFLNTPRDFIEQWRARSRTAEQVLLFDPNYFRIGDSTDEGAERLRGMRIPPGVGEYTGVQPQLGRSIVPSDTVAGAPLVAVLGHRFWEQKFGGGADVLGRSLTLDSRVYTVVGVMPAGFALPFLENYGDVFTALPSNATEGLETIAKLRRGFSDADIDREIASLWVPHKLPSGIVADAPRAMGASELMASGNRDIALLLWGAVSLVLLIACANIANLLTVRALARRREFAVRAALGAVRGRLVRQMFAEGLCLAVGGGALGVAVAWASLRAISAFQPGHLLTEGAAVDHVVLGSTAVLAVLTGLLFSLAPASFASRGDPGEVLKAGARTVAGSRLARGLRSGLVVAEVALSVVLLLGAGLLVRSIVDMQRADLGVDVHGLYAVNVRLPKSRFPDERQRHDALFSAVERVRNVAGVEDATLAITMPPDFAIGVAGIEVEGQANPGLDSVRMISANAVQPNYFRLAGIRILQGRTFVEGETNVVLINESFARRFWPAGDALGKRVRQGDGPWTVVVGVVGDVTLPGVMWPWQREVQVYEPLRPASTGGALIVRSTLPFSVVAARVRGAIRESNPRFVVGDSDSASQFVGNAFAVHRFVLLLLGAFAALALLLATLGLHAVVSFAVGQRTREFGVRVALGAAPERLLRHVLSQGLVLALAGITVGGAIAFFAVRILRALLYGVSPGDPMTIGAVLGSLFLAATAASLAPARRAMRVDPIEVLREE